MRSTTFSPDLVGTEAKSAPAARPAKSGLFASIFSGIVAGQEARARAVVQRHMATYDDAQLEALGWTKGEIARLRAPR
jgi:hypothetical protein